MLSLPLLTHILLVESLILAVMLALVFGHSGWLWWEKRRSVKVMAKARKLLMSILLEDTALAESDVKWLRTLPRRWQTTLFTELVISLSGDSRQRLTTLAEHLGLVPHAERQCRSRLWWRRLQSARLLTTLGGSDKVLLSLFQDRNPLVRAQATEWAVDYPTPEVIDALLGLLDDNHRLCQFHAQTSLLGMGGIIITPLNHYLFSHSGYGAMGALRVAVALGNPSFLTPALTLCRDESPRVRALVASLLGEIGGSQAIEVLSRLLTDSQAEVRAAAAKALGKLTHWPAAASLAALLRDSAWIVRREAALALRALGAPGMLFLRRALNDVDHFAADMARHVLDVQEPVQKGTVAA